MHHRKSPVAPPVSAADLDAFRGLMENAADIIYSTDGQGRFTLYNRAAYTLLGYDQSEMMGRSYLEVAHPSCRGSLRRFYNHQFARGIECTYREFPALHKAGSIVWLGQSVQLKIKDGKVAGFHAVARDITQRVLRESMSKRQQLILEEIARREPVTKVLDRLCRDTEELAPGARCSISLFDGERFQRGAAPSLPPFFLQLVDGHDAGPGSGTCGIAAITGRRTIVSSIRNDPRMVATRELADLLGVAAVWSEPVLGPGGETIGTFAVYYREERGPTDAEINLIEWSIGLARVAIERYLDEERLRLFHAALEQKVSQRTWELERAQEQLLQARKLESAGRLAGGLAHEFNNWLTVVLLHAEQLAQTAPASEQECVAGIRGAAERASSLTRQLLAFSRKQVLKPRVMSVNSMLHQLEPMLRALMGSRISLSLDLSPALWTVKADIAQLEHVVMNLAMNARDAMSDGGEFTVRTSNVPAEAAGAWGLPPVEHILLEAADTGHGMDAATLEHIFEPFFTTKEAGRGTGLGLATVYGIVRQSGGEIRVESAPGKGTAFQVLLPRGGVREGSRPGQPDWHSSHGNSEPVLVVEDDDSVRRLICTVLTKAGYRVFDAAGVEDGLRVVRERHAELRVLLTDLTLSDGSGMDLAGAATAVNPSMRVIFVSGHAQPSRSDDGMPRAEDVYLPKPFTAQMLVEKVREALAASGSGVGEQHLSAAREDQPH